MQSQRNAGNQRQYKAEVLRHVSVIKAAQKIGISLDAIRQAFMSLPNAKTPDKDDLAALSNAWKIGLDSKIHYLQKLRDSLTGCIGCGCLSMNKCPIYNPEDILADDAPGAVLLEQRTDSD
ncbi:redox-sensitive transcriptional activator SoxR [Aliiglaciecola sp. LCG003]|uniref:redox-sensitive transcriptional activator SoxR n=1 Tax=Aliiglaciecola sp. LCG003 TaxID=3053655 RepID=UPI0025725A12|nr:redox-sensitive transcriptional activator SoxR [Aliiglaciecola sp. LCG003]WJG11239.1 redox-sensitive transcriptional activator SoxR [Aliiglaciecola sp. LCG003]